MALAVVGLGHAATLELSRDAAPQVTPLADGHTAVLTLNHPPANLWQQLESLGAQQVPVCHGALANRAVIYLQYAPERLLGAKILVHGKVTTLCTETIGPTEALRARAQRPLPEPQQSDIYATRYAQAQKLLSAGNVMEARTEFTALTTVYGLAPWVALRLADVAVVAGEPTACALYAQTANDYPARVAGAVATLRHRSLGCEGAVPSFDFRYLRQGPRATDPMVRALLDEARASLLWVQRLDELPGLLKAGRTVFGEVLHDGLVSQFVHFADPLSVALWAQSPDASLGRSTDAHLWMQRALCSLDWTEPAETLLQRLPRPQTLGFPLPNGERLLWEQAAARCDDGLMGDKVAHPPVADAATLALAELEQRVTALQSYLADNPDIAAKAPPLETP